MLIGCTLAAVFSGPSCLPSSSVATANSCQLVTPAWLQCSRNEEAVLWRTFPGHRAGRPRRPCAASARGLTPASGVLHPSSANLPCGADSHRTPSSTAALPRGVKSCCLDHSLVDEGSCRESFCRQAVVARFRCVIEAQSFQLARALLSLWLAGASVSPESVAMDAIDPWQTPVASAVEAVEPCSRPLLFQQSWCVHVLVFTS